MTDKNTERYKFLSQREQQEEHLLGMLDEIKIYQSLFLQSGKGELATVENLTSSRNIKMPFNNTRKKNILYLLKIMTSNHGEIFKTITSMTFNFDADTRKLDIKEKTEFTLQLNGDEHSKIQHDRNLLSTESLLKFISSFRIFNLSKLLSGIKNRSYLSQLIKIELGKNIYTFKNFTVDSKGVEKSEDFCFHPNNYSAVVKKLNITALKKVISLNIDPINRELKNFGILNADFSDYRDKKLDYILNILLKGIPNTLDKIDLVETKNFNALRTCIIKVDSIIDPMVALEKDILKYIQDNEFIKEGDILSFFSGLPGKNLTKWARENQFEHKIISYTDNNKQTYFIDGNKYIGKIISSYEYFENHYLEMTGAEKREYIQLLDIMCESGKEILDSEDKIRTFLKSDYNINTLNKIIDEYQSLKKEKEEQADTLSSLIGSDENEKQSLVSIIVNFFKSMFGKKEETESSVSSKSGSSSSSSPSGKRKKVFSKDTRTLYNKIKDRSAPLIALSDFIEITHDNDSKIDTIISELRDSNLKIVIPIYNAQKVLYPKRNRNFLIADSEYLMVAPDLINSPEEIRSFTDSIAGYKLKEETISNNAVFAIEKYLLTLHRQNKAKLRRKKEKSKK